MSAGGADWPSAPMDNLPMPPDKQTTFRCAECGAIWRTDRQRDLCCTAAPEFPQTTLDRAALKQSAWAEACRSYAMTYNRGDPQRDLWLRRAERPKGEAHLVR